MVLSDELLRTCTIEVKVKSKWDKSEGCENGCLMRYEIIRWLSGGSTWDSLVFIPPLSLSRSLRDYCSR